MLRTDPCLGLSGTIDHGERGAQGMAIHFYGFLHLADRERSAVNVRVSSFSAQVRTYTLNALALSQSLKAHGYRFTLLTNNPQLIVDSTPEATGELELATMEFSTKVPSGVRFYSGHYKLDVFRYLGQLPDDYLALIDLDMLCVNPAPAVLDQFIAQKTALYYDITQQVVASSGEQALLNQLEAILQRPTSLWWSGGEFLAGPPRFFSDLAEAASAIFDRYLEVSVGAARVGNEPYQNAALHILHSNGVALAEAGSEGLVGRYWNMPVKHRQPPFRSFARHFLLHLPVDKHVLALIARAKPKKPEHFLYLYRTLKWLWLPLELFHRARKLWASTRGGS